VQLYYQIALTGRRDLPLAPDEFGGFTMTLMRMLAFAPHTSAAPRESEATPGTGRDRQPNARAAAPAKLAHTSQHAGATQLAAPPVASAVTPPVALRDTPLAAPGDTPPAAPVRAPDSVSSAAAALASNADWLTLVAALNAGGMAQMLARHCELRGYDGKRLELAVPPEHRHLLDPAYQEKLVAAIRGKLGAQVRVNISVGDQSGASLAALEGQAQQARMAKAIAAIEADPFVRDMVDNLDAKLIEASIKPI
jgi:DNA polymerase III subunit gamma/tau